VKHFVVNSLFETYRLMAASLAGGGAPAIATSLVVVAIGACLTISPLASTLGFVPLPPLFWLFMVGVLLGYALLTQLVKSWFIRRFGE
jgi:Mg2+-importing ATPase